MKCVTETSNPIHIIDSCYTHQTMCAVLVKNHPWLNFSPTVTNTAVVLHKPAESRCDHSYNSADGTLCSCIQSPGSVIYSSLGGQVEHGQTAPSAQGPLRGYKYISGV